MEADSWPAPVLPPGRIARGAGRVLRYGLSMRLMTAIGHKRKGREHANVVCFAPRKPDLRLARFNECTHLATCKTYARCGFVPPPDASDKNLHALVMCLQ